MIYQLDVHEQQTRAWIDENMDEPQRSQAHVLVDIGSRSRRETTALLDRLCGEGFNIVGNEAFVQAVRIVTRDMETVRGLPPENRRNYARSMPGRIAEDMTDYFAGLAAGLLLALATEPAPAAQTQGEIAAIRAARAAPYLPDAEMERLSEELREMSERGDRAQQRVEELEVELHRATVDRNRYLACMDKRGEALIENGERIGGHLRTIEALREAGEALWSRARNSGHVPGDATVTVFMADCRAMLAAITEAGRPPEAEDGRAPADSPAEERMWNVSVKRAGQLAEAMVVSAIDAPEALRKMRKALGIDGHDVEDFSATPRDQ